MTEGLKPKKGRPPGSKLNKVRRVSVSNAYMDILTLVGEGYPSAGLTKIITFYKKFGPEIPGTVITEGVNNVEH
jgi:hypothetical protein